MLANLASKFRIRSLVYRCTANEMSRRRELHSRCDTWIRASESAVEVLFGDDPARRGRFLRFVRAGFPGLFLVRNGEWVSYGWVTAPGAGRPRHLPRWAGKLGAWWIFYCHTREEFRGQGNYKRLLAQLVALIRARDPAALILCDTLPENFASRSAVLQSGFVPAGEMVWYRPLPGIAAGGSWLPNQMHQPQFDCVAPDLRQKTG